MIANSTDNIYRGLKGKLSPMLDSCSIDNLSIEIYENQFFRSDFTQIHVYLFRLFFLATLNIYKDYFKGHHNWCKWMKLDVKVLFKQIVIRDKFAIVHLSLEEVAAFAVGFCNQGASWSSSCWWTEELCN